MKLSQADFGFIVRHMPLVSIDLFVRNPDDAILLGLRRNEPAKDTWFVPGGVIRKGETRAQAFERISHMELGHALSTTTHNFSMSTSIITRAISPAVPTSAPITWCWPMS